MSVFDLQGRPDGAEAPLRDPFTRWTNCCGTWENARSRWTGAFSRLSAGLGAKAPHPPIHSASPSGSRGASVGASAIHRNVTVRRLALDFCQALRCQRLLTAWLGRPYRLSQRYIEIDLTYRCNLRCRNCNRSCTQAPSRMDLPLTRIEAFIRQSTAEGRPWERIRLLGGEPTLHPEFAAAVALLRGYRSRVNHGLRIVVCTNGSGARVRRRLDRLPRDIEVKNTRKGPRQRLFRPFNLAPMDRALYRWSDFSSGCRILADCGIGLTPLGYYPCAVAGAIDRIFGFGRGRSQLPAPGETMREDLALFCRRCGHFGFSWPTHRARLSPTWRAAYQCYENGLPRRPSSPEPESAAGR